MMKIRIAFRVDGNKEIGMGHVVRCISLAYMLKEKYKICFFVNASLPGLQDFITSYGFDAVSLNSEEAFLDQVNESDIVVLDGYHFSEAYQEKIKENKAGLACIDDLHDKKYIADLIINHVPGMVKENYHALSQTLFALGTDYALLRPLFLKQAGKKRAFSEIKSVFLCFGGADFKNLTVQVLGIIKQFSRFQKIIVVTGLGYQYHEQISEIMATDERISLHHNVNEEDMLSLMLAAELAVVPASGILYEAIAAGNIIITGMYIDNQKMFLREFSKFKNVLNSVDFSRENVLSALEQAFTLTHVDDNLIDGKSGERLLELFQKIL